ncbi:LD-carboxypeptidase [Mangrovivirga sp. M17]|uniref:LD-carboxypeptidase n=1 Tax=Mangrovivirga halotolerans TaxID=2993936 RepID=A0ABT3RSI6_9BACT|nr:LD-carboxypeptidase [Mangrovivirga halotolerans]MCX2744537.1 LD-carboxypeptidase [Mangrovivirga halotolerans]
MIIPEFLSHGDKVIIVATARAVDSTAVEHAVGIMENWGLKVLKGKNLLNKEFRFAGDDKARVEDFQKAISSPDIKAVFCVRGGYGTTRIVDKIDFKPLYKYPKWILGFSDITTLLLQLERLGIASSHSSMPALFKNKTSEEAIDSIRQFLMEPEDYKLEWKKTSIDKVNDCHGSLIGGNLSMIANNIGTKSFPLTFENKILFLEEVGEDLYRIDRSIVQLKRAGVLSEISGLLVGGVTDVPYDEEPFGLEASEIVLSHVSEYDFPVYFDVPFGHIDDNFLIPCGLQSKIRTDGEEIQLIVKK